VEGGNLPQTRFSHHCTKTAGNFLERFRDFSYILATEPQNVSVTVPQILVGTKGPQVVKNSGRRATDGKKSDGCFHVQTRE